MISFKLGESKFIWGYAIIQYTPETNTGAPGFHIAKKSPDPDRSFLSDL